VAFVHEARGDRATSDRLLADVYEVEETSRKRVSTVLSPLVICTQLLRGDREAARERLDRVLGYDAAPENLPLLRLAEAELLLAEERWGALDELGASMRREGETGGARYLAAAADRAAGRVRAAAGEAAGAMQLLEAAATAYDRLGMAVDAGVARVDAADAACVAGRGDDATRLAHAALEPLRRAGFRREIDRAESLLGRADGALTPHMPIA
jgi:hypothetical protein